MAKTLRKVLSTILTLSFLLGSSQFVIESAENESNDSQNIFEYWNNSDVNPEKEYTGSYLKDSTHEYDNSIAGNNSLINFSYGNTKNTNVKKLVNDDNPFVSQYHATEWNSVVGGSESIYTKKTINPTNIDGEFEVVMDLISSNVTTYEDPLVDIMFVIDKSSSMRNTMGQTGTSRWDILLSSLDTFVNSNLDVNNDNIRMGLVNYGTYAGFTSQEPYADVFKFKDAQGKHTKTFTNNPADIVGDKNKILRHELLRTPPVPNTSDTPTYLGVDIGAKILKEDSREGAKKVLIVLTDGYPNYYHINTKISPLDPASFYQKRIDPKAFIGPDSGGSFSARYKDTPIGSETRGSKYSDIENGEILKNVQLTTKNTMVTISDSYNSIKDADIFSIGFGFKDELSDTTKTKVSGIALLTIEDVVHKFLEDLGPQGMYRADNQKELDDLFEEISAAIEKSEPLIKRGFINSEISEEVDLLEDSITTHSLSLIKNGEYYDLTEEDLKSSVGLEQAINGNTLEFSNITLGGSSSSREGVRIKYKVKLKEGFKDTKFYLTSKSSTGILGSDKNVAFTNPSIREFKLIKGSVPYLKVWTDLGNAWNTRENITLQLEIKNGDSWIPVDKQSITEQSDLNGVFEDVDLSINGVNFEYRVVELDNLVHYEDPAYRIENNTHIVENKLKLRPLNLTKVGDSNDLLLEGVEFTLYRYDDQDFTEANIGNYVSVNLKSDKLGNLVDSSGKVLDIPIGNYLLRETKPLLGYESMEDLLFTVESDMSIVGVGNGLVVNNLKPFTLNIEKYDNNGNALAGVEFTLKSTDGNGYEKNQFADATDGNQFTFEGLLPGTYELTETVTPNGYVGLKKPISIEISLSGEVKVDGVVDSESGVGINGNTIQLTVINTPKGILPLTGGSGTNFIIGGGFAIVVLSMLLGLKSRKSKDNFRNGKLAKVVVLSALVLLVTGPNTISANNDYYTIKIHSRNHKDTGNQYENTGLQNNHDNSVGINGISYKVYDADIFIEGLSESNSREEIQRIVMDSKLIDLHEDENIAPYLMETIVSKNVDGTDGVATFKLAKSSSTNSLLFVQEEVVDDKHVFSSMLLILPVMDPDNPDEILNLIHLYPKENSPKVEPPVEKPEPPVEELPSTGIENSNTLKVSVGILLVGLVVLIISKNKKGKENE